VTRQSDMLKRSLAAVSIGAWILLSAWATILPAAPPPSTTTTAPLATTATASVTTVPVDLPTPDASKFRVFDRPSDDGSALIIEWARPEGGEAQGVSYVVEIARSPEDFAENKFKSIPAKKRITKDQKKQYVQWKQQYVSLFSGTDNLIEYLQVTPSDHFPAQPPGELDPERIDTLRQDKRLTDEQAARAKAALLLQGKDKGELSDREQSDRVWLDRFRAFLSESDKKRQEELRQQVNSRTYYFRLATTDGARRVYAAVNGEPAVVSAAGEIDLFKGYKLNHLLFVLIFSAAVVGFIHAARRNPNLFIRKIPGLDAVEEAIGRATEMGRSVFYVPGLALMDHQGTIAAVTVLAQVARQAAEYDTRVKVMNLDPIVTAVTQEVVQQAYTEAGRPDAYNADDVALAASTQFSFVAAVAGRMVREKPAAVFLMGHFYAESLLLAETGASTGAIQVAGTDALMQLPFFITTCDYTLIGEELYAASAYLSREPKMLGSLKGQDVGKAFLMAVIIIGAVLLALGVELFRNLFQTF